MSVVPWTNGKLLVWDATCTDTYAPSNIGVAVTGAGVVAEKSEQHKISKYLHLDSTYMFIPMAVEASGVFGPQSLKFIKDLRRCIRTTTDEANSKQYLLQQSCREFRWPSRGEHSLCSWDFGPTGRPFLTLPTMFICLFVRSYFLWGLFLN